MWKAVVFCESFNNSSFKNIGHSGHGHFIIARNWSEQKLFNDSQKIYWALKLENLKR